MWQNFVNWLMTAWNWLNQPLPVVGVSTIFIGLFVWRIFASTSLGKKQIRKLNEGFDKVRTEQANARDEEKKFEDNIKLLIAEKDAEIKQLKEIIKQLCNALPNKKAKAIGEKVYGEREERTND